MCFHSAFGLVLSAPFYTAFTVAGLSWFFRFFVEMLTPEYIVTVSNSLDFVDARNS